MEYDYAAAEGTAVWNAPAAPPFNLGGGVVRRYPIVPAEQSGFQD